MKRLLCSALLVLASACSVLAQQPNAAATSIDLGPNGFDAVVYVQVYLEDTNHYRELNDVFASYFPKDPPARGVLGVARVPESPVQITAVAVRDLHGKQPVVLPNLPANKAYSSAMLTYDRLFVSTMQGIDSATGKIPQDPAAQVNLALDQLKAVLQ